MKQENFFIPQDTRVVPLRRLDQIMYSLTSVVKFCGQIDKTIKSMTKQIATP